MQADLATGQTVYNRASVHPPDGSVAIATIKDALSVVEAWPATLSLKRQGNRFRLPCLARFTR